VLRSTLRASEGELLLTTALLNPSYAMAAAETRGGAGLGLLGAVARCPQARSPLGRQATLRGAGDVLRFVGDRTPTNCRSCSAELAAEGRPGWPTTVVRVLGWNGCPNRFLRAVFSPPRQLDALGRQIEALAARSASFCPEHRFRCQGRGLGRPPQVTANLVS
jgi:hypothetical protein